MRGLIALISAFLFALPAFAQVAEPEETVAPLPSNLDSPETNPWDVCNETSYVLRFASAYIRSDRMRAEGWTTILPGACVSMTTPSNSPRFLFAESLPVHRGGVREWKGNVTLCATEEDFTSDATDKCRLKNMDTRSYFAVKPTETRTAFIEPSDFGIKASTAGIQRLLRDAGYRITRVDGLSGRRTLRTIATARADLGLDKDADDQALITALIPAAEKIRDSIGLDICNDGTSNMFGAIAVQQDGNWTSRGWWEVEPGACVKPYDRSLIGTDAHVFALQEAKDEAGQPAPDRRLRAETVTPAQFCIAESRFSALGREKCLEQGYAVAAFRPVPTDADGQILRLTDADFVDGGGDGLRR